MSSSSDSFAQRADRLLGSLDIVDMLAVRQREHDAELRQLLLGLLDVADSIDRCFGGAVGNGSDSTQPTQGWPLTLRRISHQLDQALATVGVTSIDCLGELVDPAKHEVAGTRQASPDNVDDTILEIAARGFAWRGEILRRPRVIVAHTQSREQ